MESLDILRELVGFPTLSSAPNRALIEAASARLTAAGARVQLIQNNDGTKANLYATLGPDDRPGVLLSGHTDVVPVEGQDWTRDPFAMAVEDGRAYGRGTADMKGFVACMLALAERIGREQIRLETPL
ncbi:MAG: M20/M25/M40 family metallo-hydrolase, partial [Pseudomonadota bacterium]|nr:M20/M25/M40 family metallo-hydrolase [Pseudomonadota bacterium]